METVVNVQPENAESPILIVFFGIVTLASALHPLNALSPILRTDFGLTISVIPVQSENDDSGIASIQDMIVSVLIT